MMRIREKILSIETPENKFKNQSSICEYNVVLFVFRLFENSV